MSISLVAALGNPGAAYAATRHNLGWVVLDAFVRRENLAWSSQPRFESEIARRDRAGQRVWFAKPQTFMNDNGRTISALARFHRIPVEEVLVIYDDIGLDVGRVKVSERGSAGGHNGVASVLEHLGEGFVRYRLGIGPRQPPEMDLKDFVLGKFSPEQQLIIDRNRDFYLQGLDLLLTSGVDRAMNRLNRRETHEPDQA